VEGARRARRGVRDARVDGPYASAPILDDQWLGSLIETGAVGVFALTG
jgi:hypothetical protein